MSLRVGGPRPSEGRDWIVIATYCERENLRVLLPRLREVAPGARVCIVDDDSPDGTAQVPRELGLESFARVVVRRGRRGYGTAVRDGILACHRAGAGRIVTMDADFSHDPAEVPAMFAALDRADLCIGSRYTGGVRVLNWRISRLLLSLFANAYVRAILGFRVEDCTSGFRAYRAGLVPRLGLRSIRSNGYSFLVEMLQRCSLAGARIVEHPIVYVERREGQSKMSRSVILESVLMPWRLRLSSIPGWSRPRR